MVNTLNETMVYTLTVTLTNTLTEIMTHALAVITITKLNEGVDYIH